MTTATELQSETAIEWISFPFTYLGRSYNSKISFNSNKLETIVNLPAGVFSTMNTSALRDISTITASSTVEEIKAELERLNDGASWAVLELAGE